MIWMTPCFRADILVIANAYVRDEFRNHPAMTPPSAFSDEEIERVRRWVESGGNLLVLADHAPLGGGSSKLAEAFGFTYLNGHATAGRNTQTPEIRHVVITFKPNQGLNTNTPVTDGSTGRKPIQVFHTFGGQAFISAPDAMQVLTIPEGWSAIFTYKLAEEIRTAPRIDASGMAQGAIMEVGKGRVAIFGEAGGFTAQVSAKIWD
ncbi:MAG: hypothetical protein R3D34_06435 [Nitratireductor sp.]